MEKPYLNVVTNDTLADVYTRNANSLGVKFESNMEKIKDVSFDLYLEERWLRILISVRKDEDN